MITAGIILTIDYSSNNCTVRVPLFESVGMNEQAVLECKIAVQPGLFNGYKVNDTVWLGFIEDKINQPVILGKIYESAAVEGLNSGGHLNVQSLDISGATATIPKETVITDAPPGFTRLQDLIDEIKNLKISIDQQKDHIKVVEQNTDSALEQMGMAVRDANGDILYDAAGEMLCFQEELI